MRRLLLGLCLLAAACGGGLADPSASSASEPATSTTSPSEKPVQRCDETSLPTADPSLYRDTPKYVGNEMPTETVREWASQYPDFVDIWIDREHNGWVAAGFTGDVADRQAEIETEFPDEGVVAVHLDWTGAGLADLEARVVDELGGVVEILGTSVDVLRGYVRVSIDVVSEENLEAIGERFPDDRICVEGLAPEDVVPPGPQPQEGDGWRLLVDRDEVGEVYRVGIAWDGESLTGLVESIPGLDTIDAGVDFESEVVVWFGAVHGSTCPNLRLDDVVVDGDVVHAEIVNTDNAMACTDDAIPHTYLVALQRDRLPAPPFYIALGPEPQVDRLLVEADLRAPGSAAGPGEVGPDPDPPGREPQGSGIVIEPGFPWDYTVDLSCGFENIGEINSFHWTTTEEIPGAWIATAEGRETVVVGVLLQEGPEPTVEVTFQGETVVYEPGDATGCR